MSLGRRIKELRETLGLTQPAFAERIGVTKRAVQEWEAGRRSPSEPVLRQIEQTFNVNPEWLREGKGEMFKKEEPTEVGSFPEDVLVRALAEKLVEKLEKKLKKRGKKLTDKQREELVEMLTQELIEFGEIKTLRIENLLSA